MTRVMIRAVDQIVHSDSLLFCPPREYILVLYSRSRFQFALDFCSLYVLCNSRECKTYVYSSLFVFFPPFRFLHVYVCVNINISVALALALSSSARVSSRSISLAHPLSLSQSLPPFLSLPFSPSTVSSSGEETHPRPLLTLTLDPLLHERALIFPSFPFFGRLNRKYYYREKWREFHDPDVMILIDRSLDCEMTTSSQIRCMYILRVFVRRWTRWGRRCSSSSSSCSSYPSFYFPDVFCCWIFDFFFGCSY